MVSHAQFTPQRGVREEFNIYINHLNLLIDPVFPVSNIKHYVYHFYETPVKKINFHQHAFVEVYVFTSLFVHK